MGGASDAGEEPSSLNYLIRALLYAGRPNWRVLRSIIVR